MHYSSTLVVQYIASIGKFQYTR